MQDLSSVGFVATRNAPGGATFAGSKRRLRRGTQATAFVAALMVMCLTGLSARAQVYYGPYGAPYPRFYPGFYLRGMAGAAFGEGLSFKDANQNDPNAVLGPGAELNGQSNTSAIFGAGVGYRFTPLFWADVMASGIPNWRFHSGSSSPGAFTPLQDMGAKIDTISVMVNGYVDVARLFGLFAGPFQPYVMAGLGYASNHMGTMSGAVPGTGPLTGPVSFTGSTQGNFAWGAGAGVGVPIAPNIVLDVGYEYLDLGEVRSGTSGTLTTGGVPITAAAGPMKAGLRAQTVQASLRFGF